MIVCYFFNVVSVNSCGPDGSFVPMLILSQLRIITSWAFASYIGHDVVFMPNTDSSISWFVLSKHRHPVDQNNFVKMQ